MKTVAQSSIEELIGELQCLATASRRVGNHAIGDSVGQKASQLLTEIRQVFATATPPTEQATEGGVTTERDVRCHVAAPAQGETPHKVACRLLNESDPNNVDKWREVNAVEAIITPLVRELNEAKADVLRGIQRDAARLVEDTARAGELATLRQSVARLTQERDEARDQWRMSSVCRELQAKLTAAESELAELRKDRERLEWLENACTRLLDLDTDPDQPQRYRLEYWQGVNGHKAIEAETITQAIDAARNQQEKKE